MLNVNKCLASKAEKADFNSLMDGVSQTRLKNPFSANKLRFKCL